MLLIQQSPSFRAWTSRALMIYFRRALLFLVVSSRQYINNNHYLLQQQQQQRVYFSDAEDDEEILMIDEKRIFTESSFDRNQNNSNQIQISQSKRNLLKEYVFNKLSQGLNNSMIKSIQKETINSLVIESIDESSSKLTSISSLTTDQSSKIFHSIQPTVIEQFKPSIYNSNQGFNSFLIKTINNTKMNENKVLDDSIYQYQMNPSCSSWQQIPVNYHNQIYDRPMLSYPSCPSCLPLSSISDSSDDETSSSESNKPPLLKSPDQYSSISIQQTRSQISDNADDIYEKYQTSFSHILHQTKSLHTICKEGKLQSMLILEPNTSIVTVHQLTYHPLNPNTINHLMMTSDICVRLIADRIDLSIQCNTKPIGCKKPFACFPIKYNQKPLFNNIIESISINNELQEKLNLKNSPINLTDQFNKQQSSIFSNKKFETTSILIDIPDKMFYIDI